MNRRLFFLIPDVAHTQKIVDDLLVYGLTKSDMHVVARSDIDTSMLPDTSDRQRNDTKYKIKKFIWKAGLILFFCAFAVAAFLLFTNQLILALAPIMIMAICFFSGKYFIEHIHTTHLMEFKTEIAHGDILLMIDTQNSRVKEIEDYTGKRHPEVIAGGAGWSAPIMQI